MPSDDYAAVAGGGALRLKGAKVQKRKNKNKTKAKAKPAAPDQKKPASGSPAARPDTDDPDAAEAAASPPPEDDEADAEYRVPKTESERRYEEAKKKRLLQMTRASGVRPELLKTHKERVEELNTYLSKLSEHHDMPKIGPG